MEEQILDTDFSDLEELLSDSVSKQSLVLAGRTAEAKIRKGSMSEENHAEALATIRAAELIHSWEEVADVAVIEQAQCLGCASSRSSFLGFFSLQRHKRESGSKRVVKLETGKDITKCFSHTVLKMIEVCPSCFNLPELHLNLVTEFSVLKQFAK